MMFETARAWIEPRIFEIEYTDWLSFAFGILLLLWFVHALILRRRSATINLMTAQLKDLTQRFAAVEYMSNRLLASKVGASGYANGSTGAGLMGNTLHPAERGSVEPQILANETVN